MMIVSLHRPTKARADKTDTAAWVAIRDKDDNEITIFLPADKAERIAEIINETPPET